MLGAELGEPIWRSMIPCVGDLSRMWFSTVLKETFRKLGGRGLILDSAENKSPMSKMCVWAASDKQNFGEGFVGDGKAPQ